jgi:hypothetical protein
MNAVEILEQSYRIYLGQAFAALVFPWLVLVLWRRWLPRWPQTFLAAAITVLLMAPVHGFTASLGADARTNVALLGNVVGFLVIWMLRDRTPARPDQPVKYPDARWKLLLAMLGSVAAMVLISALLNFTSGARRSSLTEAGIQEVAPPSYEANFKKALESRDAWAAYAAYREADRYRDTEKLRPVIDLYAELRDPTGIAFQALIAKRESRDADRRRLQAQAAISKEPLAMVLFLESYRTDRLDDSKQKPLTGEAKLYREELLNLREYSETALACLTSALGQEVSAEVCTTIKKEGARYTALVNPVVGFGRFPTGRLPTDQVTLAVTSSFIDGMRDPGEFLGEISDVPSLSTSYGRIHSASDWPGEMNVDGYPTVPQVLDRLRQGITQEYPEAGVLLHEASFIPGYREHIRPEEAFRALRMAAIWGHPAAMKRLSALYEQGVGGVEANPTLALALLLGRHRYKAASDPDALEEVNRVAATLSTKQRETAEFSAQTWRPGGLMVLFDPEKWDQPE